MQNVHWLYTKILQGGQRDSYLLGFNAPAADPLSNFGICWKTLPIISSIFLGEESKAVITFFLGG